MCSNIPASPAYGVYKNDADEAVCVVSLTFSSRGYINGRISANLELLIDKTSSIYPYVKLKRFALFDLLKSLYSDTKILSKYFPSLQRR
jgi:hypothetical protein